MNWFGAIPARWGTLTVRELFVERKEKVSALDYPPLSVGKRGTVPQMERVSVSASNDNRKLVRVGDYVINSRSDRKGSSGLSAYEGSVSLIYHVLTPRVAIMGKFAHYLIRSHYFVEEFYRNGRGIVDDLWTTRYSEMRQIVMPLPQTDEQEQIVQWLGWQTSRIGKFVRAKRREIVCLKELKKAAICKAVTLGLSIGVPMKSVDTYFEHEIPRHWHEVKLKRVLKKLNRPYDSDAELLICSNKGTVFPRGDSKMGLVSDSDAFYQGVCRGDLLIHGMDTWHGAIAVTQLDGKCTGVVHVCDSKQDKRFITYYLQMLAFRKLYKAITNGVRQNTSDFRSWDKAGDIVVALPPTTEQEKIANYLDEKSATIDRLIAKLTDEINLLLEYRTRIISDAVTGKIDLRDAVIPDYEEEAEIPPTDEEGDDTEEGEADADND